MARPPLPFPLYAVFIGAVGAFAFVFGLLGLIGDAPFAFLADRTIAWSLVGLGGALIAAEGVIIVTALRNRPPQRR